MRSDPPPRIGLMPVFALTGALAIGLFSAGMAWLLTGLFESRLLERDAAISRDFVQSIVNTQKVAPAFGPPEAGQAAPGFGEFFAHVAAMPDVLRANVYSADRRVLWSSQAELIGQVFAANDELDRSLAGQVVVNPEDGDEAHGTKPEHVLMQGGGAEYVENYLPVRDETGQRVIGVIELYRKPVALFDAIHSGQRLVWMGAVVGGLFLFACLAWFVMRVQHALRDQQSRLVEAEALAMVGEISASVAHSIRNPLGSIRSTAELQRELGQDAPASAADDVIRQVDRIEHLVRTLLSYAREPAERGARAELGPVLADSAARFATELAAQGKAFSTELAEGLGAVAVDPVLLAQVLASVLSNAAEATKAGDTVRLAARRDGPRAVIEVEDTGAGIDPAQLGEVMRPFFTTKPRGLGLGLALVRRVAERQGGRLSVASPGARGGTRVTLELPVLPARS